MKKEGLLGRFRLDKKRKNNRRRRDTHVRLTRIEMLEDRRLLAGELTLELLHIADQEAATAAIQDAPRLSAVLNALRAEDLGNDGLADNTLTLSSGDAWIPGLFYDASEAAFGSGGIADMQIQNELGIQAISFGNHEFDFGTANMAGLIDGSAPGDFTNSFLDGTALEGLDFTGTDFPYLSTNLDFSTDVNMAPLVVAGGQSPRGNVVTSSTVIDVNGEPIGVVGATTPTLDIISDPGDIDISPSPFDTNPTSFQLDALAAVIQTEVDALLAANAEMDKIIVLAHMQQISVEFGLAERLEHVDIIVAGGSNTRLFDSNDRVRDGDSAQGVYPTFITNAGGSETAVVNTDGSYKYVGRLVIDFNDAGQIVPGSYDATVSGAYATDDQGVADLNADGLVDPEIQAIVNAIEAEIIATESNIFGISDVFLNGNRSGTGDPSDPDGVRTQETNLGNLTADANLAAAQAADSLVVVSIKNGGGIRASIGQIVVPPGGTDAERLPNEQVLDSQGNIIKPEGGISQNDIATALAFNNALSLLTLTKAELVEVLEYGVSGLPEVEGRFPQVSGVKFSFDPALPVGERVQNASIFDQNGDEIAPLVRNGSLVGDPNQTFRVVTLGFLADGGDGYPYPITDPSDPDYDPVIAARVNRVDLDDAGTQTGNATFADDGTEQDALAEYLFDNFSIFPFTDADTVPDQDARIQNLAYRPDYVVPVSGTVLVRNESDSGDGSFRAAIQIANENPGVNKIKFQPHVDSVVLESAVEYTGSQDLKIEGKRAVLRASDDFADDSIFVSSGAADLELRKLTVDGDFEDGEVPTNGIYIPVPAAAVGVLSVELAFVNVINNGAFGVWIADQLNDSAAGIKLSVNRSTVENNGIGLFDADGIRVDEGGDGDIRADVSRSDIDGNGADGLELDETGAGSVFAKVSRSSFDDNGFFDQDNQTEEQDLDDGFDIDEVGPGGIWAEISRTQLVNNFDEGLDFDEEDAGGVYLKLFDVNASENSDEGVKVDEEDEGNLVARLTDVVISRNGDDDLSFEPNGGEGMQLGETGDGDLIAMLADVAASYNGDEGIQIGEEDAGSVLAILDDISAMRNGDSGIKIEESGDGRLLARLEDVESNRNEGSGLELDESGAGSLLAWVEDSEFEGNDEYGIAARQEDDGIGKLILDDVDLDDNGEGDLDLDGVIALDD
jgi:2',3'-cyclic-nucleotide 2'-phosphodiesterase (5'-nucleotidase family)